MGRIGLLPASGKATRIGGLPKFCLPISEKDCLLSWHVNNMKEVCDEIRVCVPNKWVPLVQTLDLDIKLMVKESSTMSDAVVYMTDPCCNEYIIGMPDTYMIECENPYSKFSLLKAELTLGVWICPYELRGKVGQLDVKDGKVIYSEDKNPNCTYSYMWGNMAMSGYMIEKIDRSKNHPGEQIQEWIDAGENIRYEENDGIYVDVGTFDGFKRIIR